MIYLNFQEPNDLNWIEWKSNCETATNLLMDSYLNGHTVTINTIYGNQRHRYYDPPFNGKCAYCESNIEVNSPNYVEHFRPKGEVRDVNNQIITKSGTTLPHPGYYWLAYSWENLLPTCWACNTRHSDRSGTMIGKGTRFPLAVNHYAELPGEEVNEIPLLINPLKEDPATFIYMDKLGVLHSVNNLDKASTTITLFGLNIRTALVDGRKQEYENVYRRASLIFTIKNVDEKNNELNELRLILQGENQYTIAAKKAISDLLASVQDTQDAMNIL